jgi:cytochrome c
MDSFEMTKIAGAILSALLVIFGTRTIIEINSEGSPEKPGYTLPAATAAADATGGEAGKAADAGGGSAVPLLAKASVENGKTTFNKCKSCHSVEKGKNAVGPSLYGVVNRPKGTEEGFKYSDAMKSKGGNWTFEDLSTFLTSPKAFVPGTKMTFSGLPSAADRADLIAYLATVGDAPVPLPKAAAEAAPDGKSEAKSEPKADDKK